MSGHVARAGSAVTELLALGRGENGAPGGPEAVEGLPTNGRPAKPGGT